MFVNYYDIKDVEAQEYRFNQLKENFTENYCDYKTDKTGGLFWINDTGYIRLEKAADKEYSECLISIYYANMDISIKKFNIEKDEL